MNSLRRRPIWALNTIIIVIQQRDWIMKSPSNHPQQAPVQQGNTSNMDLPSTSMYHDTTTKIIDDRAILVPRRGPPPISSHVFLFLNHRPDWFATGKCYVEAIVTFGDHAIVYKAPPRTKRRFMFQNVTGLTFNQSGDDHSYHYDLSPMLSYSIDVLAARPKWTQEGKQYTHIQAKFLSL